MNGNPAPIEHAWNRQAARSAFASTLSDLREKSGKTLRELEKLTFASDSALSRYFAGRAVPPWRVVEALCAATGTDPRGLRASWQRARSRASNRAAAPVTAAAAADVDVLEAARRLQHRLAHDMSAIKEFADGAAQVAHRRGECVPDEVVNIQAASAAALQELRTTVAALETPVAAHPEPCRADPTTLVDLLWDAITSPHG